MTHTETVDLSGRVGNSHQMTCRVQRFSHVTNLCFFALIRTTNRHHAGTEQLWCGLVQEPA